MTAPAAPTPTRSVQGRAWLFAACAARAASEVSVVDNCHLENSSEFLPVPTGDDLILETYIDAPLSLRSTGPREIFSMHMESERLTRISCTNALRRRETPCTYVGTSVVGDGLSLSSLVTLRACDPELKDLKVVIFNITGGAARVMDGFQSVADRNVCVFPRMGAFRIPYMEHGPCSAESAAVTAAKLRLRGAAAAVAAGSVDGSPVTTGAVVAGGRWPQWRAQQWLTAKLAKLDINKNGWPVGMGPRLQSRLDEERAAVSAANERTQAVSPPPLQHSAVRLAALGNMSKIQTGAGVGGGANTGSAAAPVVLEFLTVRNRGVVVQNSTQWRYWEPTSRLKHADGGSVSRTAGEKTARQQRSDKPTAGGGMRRREQNVRM